MENDPLKFFFIALINFYQKTLSPDHGWLKGGFPYGFCRFYPSCSQYAKEAVMRFGLIKGGCLTMKRLIKCNPLHEPGVDLIPNK
jgi:hypothetical protein